MALLKSISAAVACIGIFCLAQSDAAVVGTRRALLSTNNQYEVGRANLRAAYQNNNFPHTAMASPPTITMGTTTATCTGAGLSSPYTWTGNPSLVRPLDGQQNVVGSTLEMITATQSAGVFASNTWHLEAQINAAQVCWDLLGSPSGYYRFRVNDQYVSLTGSTTSSGSHNYFLLDFTSVGGAASRKIAIETDAGTVGYNGIYLAPGDTIAMTSAAWLARGAFVGDSYVLGTGPTYTGDGFSVIFKDAMGVRWQTGYGIGSTGWLATNGGTRFNFLQRITDQTLNGPWDYVIAGSINDVAQIQGGTYTAAQLTAGVSQYLNTIRRAFPQAMIYVFGPPDLAAPGAPAASYTTTKNAIIAGMAGIVGSKFIDLQGVAFTRIGDNLHPDTAGSATLGNYIAGQVQTNLLSMPYLLNRDLDPSANDNTPLGLDAVG